MTQLLEEPIQREVAAVAITQQRVACCAEDLPAAAYFDVFLSGGTSGIGKGVMKLSS